MASCRNVETYAAAQVCIAMALCKFLVEVHQTDTLQVLYWIGYNGMEYVLHVFLSDTTDLVNRAFVWGVASTPYIATTFAGPAAAQRFYKEGALWWGFGTFAIITPVVSAPIVVLFWLTRRKAYKMGLIQKRQSGRTWVQSIRYYFVQFDGQSFHLTSRYCQR